MRKFRIPMLVIMLGLLLPAVRGAAIEEGYPGELKDKDFGRVVLASGNAYLTHYGQYVSLNSGRELDIGDVIQTGQSGTVVLEYLTDSRIVIQPNSEFKIEFLGKVERKVKGFDFRQTAGTVCNKTGGSYFGETEIFQLVPGATLVATDAEYCTFAGMDGTLVAVRNGEVKAMGTGWTQTVKKGRQFVINPGGSPGSHTAVSDTVNEQFLLAAQEMVMASYGHDPGGASTYYPSVATSYERNKHVDEADFGKEPYFPLYQMGAERKPSLDYKDTIYNEYMTTDNLPPGESFEPEIWPGIYHESDQYLQRVRPNYPYPDATSMRRNPGPQPPDETAGKSLRQVAPPPIHALTPRKDTEGLLIGDYATAYRICQNYAATQSEIDDCVTRRLKPEARPGAIKFPEPPPELNLPMTHEDAAPAFIALPPVSELPPPVITGDIAAVPVYCSFSLYRNPQIAHNDTGVDLLGQGRYAAALETFEDALRVNPNNPEVLNNIAATYYRMGDSAGAERFSKQAIANDPGNVTLHTTMGCLVMDQGKKERACAEWTMVLDQEPENAQALRNKRAFCDWE